MEGNIWKFADIRLLRGLRKVRIRLRMGHQVLLGFLSYFTLAIFVRSHRAAPGVDLPCQGKASGSILGSGPLTMTLTGNGARAMYRWRCLSIFSLGPFCQKPLVYAVARKCT